MSWYEKLKLIIGLNTVYESAVTEAKKMDPKSIFSSKTFWFNIVCGVFALLQANGAFASLPPHYLPLVDVVGNILLRFQTKQPVTLVGK